MTEVPVLPETAPFTAAQPAWLNGFFAGLFSRGAAQSVTEHPRIEEQGTTQNAKPKARDRNSPGPARLLKNQTLNGAGSSKDTRLIVFDLHGSGLSYKAGDSLGVVPENCPDTVGWLIEALDASGAEAIK